MKITLSKFSKEPLYQQIVQELKRNILSGELQEEEQLPSIRQLAKDLEVSVITVKKAYEKLEQENFLMTVPYQGTYVAHLDTDQIEAKILAEIDQGLGEIATKAKSIGLSAQDLAQRIQDRMEE
ncbi:GntR family transcriptional regulator [Aerococcus sanguinicola]|uniref:GntR family transcriptional regulator n=1 Tax=unclassified Aerococcus TaxID=2618060 RepID=UPI0008A1C4C7|nr:MULTISPECIES: GntR family transcriptional regulator [unclassified Aerococcus]KAB0647884.1 GntR family transcriptional regulator [Aerococcus sanguinicola]MDK6234225.1 GntR family transcriptional regulator [Aerococcus sp. UMB10185]MDK6856456.1 GntR family transcriptional regulator [Aerococcus sp. UMB7533]OFN01669.1 GntR family transcriptional regulator [Aerococcus sp. HMSC062A02]OHO44023.1 GntR family transcriptional regulator [Aerococcus sp. HMSC035B07]